MRLARAVIAAGLATGPAWACPVAGDLDTGIRLLANDGSSDTYRRHSEHFVEGFYSDGGTGGSVFMLLRGIYVVAAHDTANGDLVEGSRSTYAYPVAPADAPLPQPGGRWDTLVRILDGGELRTQSESFVFGDATRVTFGACGFDMLPVTAIYHDEGGYQERLHYLPDLGFAYLAATQERGQAADPVVYVQIEAVGP